MDKFRGIFAVILLLLGAATAQAQIGKIFREGAEYVGKTLLKEGAQEAAEAGGKRILREAAEESGEQLLKRSGLAAARFSDDAAKAVAKHGDSVVPLISRFGDDAAKAASSVSARNARRLAMLSDELAASPQGKEVLSLVAKGGKADQIVEFLWAHKGKIAATGAALALLANTDAVLEAGTTVSTTAMQTAGDSLIRPLAEEAAPTLRFAFGGMVLLASLAIVAVCLAIGLVVWRKSALIQRLLFWLLRRRVLAPPK